MDTRIDEQNSAAVLLNGQESFAPRLLRPFSERVAHLAVSVHTKLLTGFMMIALLLLAMGGLSIFVLQRVDNQVEQLTELHEQTDQARQMIYGVTAQSHFRAMALADRDDPRWTQKIYTAKDAFDSNLADIRVDARAARPEFFDQLSSSNEEFRESSDVTTKLFDEGKFDEATREHIAVEHDLSHDLEDSLNELIVDSDAMFRDAAADFHSDRSLLTIAIALFSGASLLGALGLGAVISWSLISPVKSVDRALESIAAGDFRPRVSVANRDEFGRLSENLNRTTSQLATLYGDLEHLNANLQTTVDEKVVELERASELKRYMSPQLAESILKGDIEVTLGSSRKNLTTVFSDIRGFTELSERTEPEELVGELNDYFSEMTEIVFEHGGTLDKYIGDAVMVFFGDPVEQEDHAARAVQMAIAMQQRMTVLEDRWAGKYDDVFSIGIGISTGWTTVGNIGSSVRTDYTVLGNQVNLASRLADRAGRGEILLTERTWKLSGTSLDATLIDEIQLKGVNRPTKLYRLEFELPARLTT